MSKYDPIPDELKERPQWLLWDASHDTPRQPHWRGDFYDISWSDPGDWHTFEEAVSAAEDRESWGIGYVMALDNDDYARGLYGCLDLDGCVGEDGTPKDWLPSFRHFDDGYIEYSASGEGIHIPLVGQEAPEWWSDSHFGADEHEGVEYLTNKFVAFTGDQLNGTESTVSEGNPAPFLHEAYKEINGESPVKNSDRGGDTGDRDRNELTESQIRDALDHVDSNVGYPEWRDILFAIHDWDDGSTGRHVAEDWSMGPGWDDQADELIAKIWDGASQGDGITVGTLIHKAQENGFTFSTQRATADGGAAAATGDSSASVSEQDELPLTPDGVMRKAFNDVYGRLQQSVDEPDPTIHDLRNSEAATYTWQVLQDRGDDDVIGVSDGTLRTYDGAVWTRDGDAAEQRLREQSRRALMSKYSSQVLEQLKEQVRATNYHHVDELGIDEPWVVAGDEALNLKTRETRPVERDDLALRRINAEYDPDAEPDLWLDFLSRVAATPETIAKVQEYFGYCLWVHGQPFGKALFLVGDTDSGKGTALKTLETILGRRENVANEALQDLIETRWGKAELYGTIANIRNEVTPGGVKNVEEFKELLGGGDRVSAEFKGQDKFQFEVTQKFLFATNQFPDVENADGAFWNRCLFARFPETIPADEQRPNFHDDLLDERAGILNWMLDGLDRLFEQEGFTGERAIGDKRTIAEEVGSPLERLKQEALEITREPDDLVHARDLYDLAVAYADANDMDGGVPAWQGGAFTSELRRWPGVEKGRSRRVTDDGDASVFKGLRVDPEIATQLNADVRTDSESDRKQSGLDV